MPYVRDRAAAATTAILQITAASSIPKSELREHIQNMLVDELAEITALLLADIATASSR
jgi:hypothetical protein